MPFSPSDVAAKERGMNLMRSILSPIFLPARGHRKTRRQRAGATLCVIIANPPHLVCAHGIAVLARTEELKLVCLAPCALYLLAGVDAVHHEPPVLFQGLDLLRGHHERRARRGIARCSNVRFLQTPWHQFPLGPFLRLRI